MKGIQFVVDEHGEKQAVLIDLNTWGEVWEAEKELRHVDRMMLERLTRAIDSLPMEPRPSGCKKLVASGNLWRVRVGEYRIVYEIYDRERLIRMVAVTHRSSESRCGGRQLSTDN